MDSGDPKVESLKRRKIQQGLIVRSTAEIFGDVARLSVGRVIGENVGCKLCTFNLAFMKHESSFKEVNIFHSPCSPVACLA